MESARAPLYRRWTNHSRSLAEHLTWYEIVTLLEDIEPYTDLSLFISLLDETCLGSSINLTCNGALSDVLV